MLSLHDHNELQRAPELIVAHRRAAPTIALVSDAGTPGISDPGFDLVRACAAAGIEIIAIPGPCAAVAALSIAALPTDRFCFEGFLPARRAARRARLDELAAEPRTLVFYESPHRVQRDARGLRGELRRRRAAPRSRARSPSCTKRYTAARSAQLAAARRGGGRFHARRDRARDRGRGAPARPPARRARTVMAARWTACSGRSWRSCR